MSGGLVDCLGFIGGSKGADALIKQHPQPHRLKVFSQLEGKNLGIVFPDADLDAAAKQIVLGSLSYNGQRCTAIKLVVAHASIAKTLAAKLAEVIEALPRGQPWDENVSITPLPEPSKPAYRRPRRMPPSPRNIHVVAAVSPAAAPDAPVASEYP